MAAELIYGPLRPRKYPGPTTAPLERPARGSLQGRDFPKIPGG